MDMMDVEEMGIAGMWEEQEDEQEEQRGAADAGGASWAHNRTTPLGMSNCGDDSCGPSCTFLRPNGSVGNVFYCTAHHGAIHVCDMRCKFRDLAMSDSGAISYRCRISGLVTTRRLLLPCSTSASAQVNKRGAEQQQHEDTVTPKASSGGAFAPSGWARPRFG